MIVGLKYIVGLDGLPLTLCECAAGCYCPTLARAVAIGGWDAPAVCADCERLCAAGEPVSGSGSAPSPSQS